MITMFAFSGMIVLGMELLSLLKILVTLYAAVLFTQSGFDKVIDWSGNKAYLTGVLNKSILGSLAPVIIPLITLLEVATGLFCLAGAGTLIAGGSPIIAVIGLLLGAVSILSLFSGMRLAKDYGGAAGITPYFIFFIGALVLFAA